MEMNQPLNRENQPLLQRKNTSSSNDGTTKSQDDNNTNNRTSPLSSSSSSSSLDSDNERKRDEMLKKQQQEDEKRTQEEVTRNKILLNKADKHMREGRGFYRKRQYELAIKEFKNSLKLRESFIGRYDSFTAGVYYFIGNCYYQIEEYDNALIAYRTRLRIRRRLQENDDDNQYNKNLEKNSPSMDNRFISALEKKGLSNDAIKKYDTELTLSLQHEKVGDTFREHGEYKKAVFKYKRAIAIEKKWYGGAVTAAFLWRKVAYLVDRMDELRTPTSSTPNSPTRSVLGKYLASTSGTIDWKKADCIDSDNMSVRSKNSTISKFGYHGSNLDIPALEKRLSENDVFAAIKNLGGDSGDEGEWDGQSNTKNYNTFGKNTDDDNSSEEDYEETMRKQRLRLAEKKKKLEKFEKKRQLEEYKKQMEKQKLVDLKQKQERQKLVSNMTVIPLPPKTKRISAPVSNSKKTRPTNVRNNSTASIGRSLSSTIGDRQVPSNRVSTAVIHTENGIVVKHMTISEEPDGWGSVFDDQTGKIKV